MRLIYLHVRIFPVSTCIPPILLPRNDTYCTPLIVPFVAELAALTPIGDPLLSTRPNLGAAGDEKFDLRFTEPPFKGRLVAEPGVNPSSLSNVNL